MTEGAYTQRKGTSPTALTIVVLMHGAALGGLALSKFEVEGLTGRKGPIDIFEVPPPSPPPPPPQIEPQPTPEPVRHIPAPYVPPVIVPTPRPTIDLTTTGVITLPRPSDLSPPAEKIVLPPPPPLPAPPKKVQAARAKADLGTYVSNADYPAAALRNEDEGTTRFRLTVGPDGRVSGCTVTSSSGSGILDRATCSIMQKRARFTPARDSNGKPTADTVSSAIRWELPG